MKTLLSGCLASLMMLTLATPVHATEGGGGAYPNGAEGFMAGAVPPPGNYLVDYVLYYSADTFNGPDGNSALPVFDLQVLANVVRLIHVSETKVFGGFWAAHVFIPIMDLDVTVPGMNDRKTALGDIIVDPMVLSWHSENWHAAAGLDIFIPSGSYDAADLANVSRGYWTLEPVFGCTYMSDGGLDVSAKFMYDFNLENSDTDYTSGQELHADYTVAQRFGPCSVGVGGYYYQQVTDDECDTPGVSVSGKGKALAVGPQIKYDAGKMSFIAKYQKEVETENRPEGEAVWLKFICAF